MATIASTATVEHYTWGDGCDGWHLLKRPDLSIIHERMPPGTKEVRHAHRHAQQFFFVLGGTLDVEMEGMQIKVHAHEGVHVPAGAAHQVHNTSATDAEFLVISQPASQCDRELMPQPGTRI